jgi:MEMO1 family protein
MTRFKSLIICVLLFTAISLHPQKGKALKNPGLSGPTKLRGFADTIGFAHFSWQMDTVMQRIRRHQRLNLNEALLKTEDWKTVICPHDDYTYTGYLYPAALAGIKARTVIVFGVAHKAKQLKLENKIIFDSYSHWKAPYGNVVVSRLRDSIIKNLPDETYEVNDSMQTIEHSVEAIVPFLQYSNREVEIISILVPHSTFGRMDSIAKDLSASVKKVLEKENLLWGKDIAMVISNDAVHYGDEGWGGKHYARYEADTAGYHYAVEFENMIINDCLAGELAAAKIKKFNRHTIDGNNFRDYKWTWCGRYSVPFGLLTSLYLNQELNLPPLSGKKVAYSTSIENYPLSVSDIRMGITAPANIRHWVGYAVVGYR